MAKEEGVEFQGVVKEAVKNGFIVTVESAGAKLEIFAKPAGRLNLNKINIVPGDKVKVEVSPYDMKKGRITYRDR